MLFNSLIFFVFIALFFAFWWAARKQSKSRWWYICAFSFFFYGWWDWRFLFLLLFTGFIDWLAGLWMEKFPARRKLLLVVSLGANIGSLAIFKYSEFAATQLDKLFALMGMVTHMHDSLPAFSLVLPVGISFYTFNSMSYTIDVYRGLLKPKRSLVQFFAFISLFPHLVAGPIVRARDILGQLEKWRPVTGPERWNAFKLVAIGYFQKCVIADNLAPFVEGAFEGNIRFDSSLYWWMVMVCFSLQIYFDFAGYSSIARGMVKGMGMHFRMNFNHPYTSLSLREFWTRWHISLSTWFRDYLYIPLGGAKRGKWRGILNLWITMLVSGIWHGANFTFLGWGGVHALFQSIERLTKWPRIFKKIPFGSFIVWGIVMLQVIVAWVFFRAKTFEQAGEVLANMFGKMPRPGFVTLYPDIVIFLLIGIGAEALWRARPHSAFLRRANRNPWVDGIGVAMLVVAAIYFRGPQSTFIYFQF